MLLLCNYYVTYKCNAFCEFCHFADHQKYKNSVMEDFPTFKKNIDELAQLGVKFIDLTGGEPLLNPNIAEMARYAKLKKMQTSITTNTLLYPKFAETLAGNVDLLHFSLDSPDAEEHNKIRGVKCFDKVFESINIAKQLGEYPDILFTVTNENYKKLPRMHAIASSENLVLIVNPVFSYFGNPGLNDEAIDFIEDYSSGKMNIYLNKAFLKLRRNGGNNPESPSCKAVSRVIVISPENEIILPCYHFESRKIKIDKPIAEIRAVDEYKYFEMMEGRFNFCEGCTVNCYFEPSFAFPTNAYAIAGISSKIKYGYNKLVKQKIKKLI